MKKIDESKLIQAAHRFTGGGGEPPMSVLEVRLSSLEKDVAVIKSNYATKADLMSLKGDIKKLRSGVQGDVKELRSDFKGECQHLKGFLSAEIHKATISQIKWIIATLIGSVLAVSAIATLAFKFL